MKLKFIADVHISPLTVSALKKAGYQIIRVTECMSAYALDEEIIQYAYFAANHFDPVTESSEYWQATSGNCSSSVSKNSVTLPGLLLLFLV